MNKMMQDEINRAEWKNPDNWGEPDWAATYFSKKDSRFWVPKKNPKMGATINFAHSLKVSIFMAAISGIPILAAVVATLILCGDSFCG